VGGTGGGIEYSSRGPFPYFYSDSTKKSYRFCGVNGGNGGTNPTKAIPNYYDTGDKLEGRGCINTCSNFYDYFGEQSQDAFGY
jgi:hypothetical protein